MKKFLLGLILLNSFVLAVGPGDYVCRYDDREKDSKWCGTILQNVGNKFQVDVTLVNCNSGGFLGICTNFRPSGCTGNIMLENGGRYNIYVPKYCVE